MSAPDGTTFAKCDALFGKQNDQICRWDQRAGWQRLPRIAPDYNTSAGVATSSSSLWIGGYLLPDPSATAGFFSEHWDGSTWQRGPSGIHSMFRPLFATGPDDVWAWSEFDTMHWNGHAWERLLTGGPGTDVLAIDGLAKNDVWLLDTGGRLSHWDGAEIRFVAALPAGLRPRALDEGRRMIATPSGPWIVGATTTQASPVCRLGRILHYGNGA